MNYFERFGFEVSPVVDADALYRKYIELQRASHPDFFTQESEDEKEDALTASAEINKAYRTFKDPLQTIAYFLKVKGVMSDDEKYRLPNDFLMEMMELNEAAEEDRDSAMKGAAAVERILDEQAGKNGQRTTGNGQKDSYTSQDLAQLKEYYFKKKYLQRLTQPNN